MKQLITPNWRASTKTINGLINGGWSSEQRKRKLLLFIERYGGQKIEGASSKYNSWVREETPRNVKKKETGKALKEVLAKQTNKSKDGPQRAKEAKEQTKVMTQEQVEEFYNKRHLGE